MRVVLLLSHYGENGHREEGFLGSWAPPPMEIWVGSLNGSPRKLDVAVAQQGSLKDAFCPFETWLFPPKYRDNVQVCNVRIPAQKSGTHASCL